jgi:hypothetical protein
VAGARRKHFADCANVGGRASEGIDSAQLQGYATAGELWGIAGSDRVGDALETGGSQGEGNPALRRLVLVGTEALGPATRSPASSPPICG